MPFFEDPSLAAAHEEAARHGDSRQPEEVQHHYICYVNKDGTLFEIGYEVVFSPFFLTFHINFVVFRFSSSISTSYWRDQCFLFSKMSMPQWRALESNPDTINASSYFLNRKIGVWWLPINSFQFMNKIGVHGVECVDVFSFEPEMLDFIPSPQLALILCFPEREGKVPLQTVYDALLASGAKAPDNVFFMKQKIGNACGTFALFHSLANLEGVIDLGNGSFHNWLKEAKELSTEERSDSLLKSELFDGLFGIHTIVSDSKFSRGCHKFFQ
ncbi:unnamed protein product [Strongylus vulgaris]|uniref:ubiquitinyl hydrolase 1 n=1 Tax=Strongylus vulgaris TaxID=40348 RepID=A0A3P7J3J7_STRVU|nr:unnamed protein product [Strongylus vulgaris]